MERKNILTSQKEIVVNSWKEGFRVSHADERIVFIYNGDISAETYCAFICLDFQTLKRLGVVSYSVNYVYDRDTKEYVLQCHTYIDNVMNEKLSVELTDSEDWLELFRLSELEKREETEDTLKAFLSKTTDEIVDYLKENEMDLWQELRQNIINELEADDLLDGLKEEVAEDWISENSNSAFRSALSHMGNYEIRDALKEAIDEL